MTHPIIAIVAGHVCLDITPDLGHTTTERFMATFRPGRLLNAGPATVGGGGAVSNTGRALQILGIPTTLMGKVGDDPLGLVLRKVLGVLEDDQGMIVDPASPTSYSIVISPGGADRIFLHCPGANDSFAADDIRYDLVAQARLFHFGYPPLMRQMYADGGAQLANMFRHARATGATTSLDLALPDPNSDAGHADWPSILAGTLPEVDIFLPSIEEILFMLRRDTYAQMQSAARNGDILPLVAADLLSDLSAQMLDLGVKIAGLKLGKHGFYLRTAGAAALAGMGRGAPADPAKWAGLELWAPIFQAREVTTTGAGDSAIAGFLCGLLNGAAAETALVGGCAVGACNVEAADSVSGLRSWDATQARIAAGWPQLPLEVRAPGWQYNPAARLWRRD